MCSNCLVLGCSHPHSLVHEDGDAISTYAINHALDPVPARLVARLEEGFTEDAEPSASNN